MDVMSDFGGYINSQLKTEIAKEKYNHSSTRLELARIKERFAEIKSQHDPLNKLLEDLGYPMDSQIRNEIREKLINLVNYVVVGRPK